jgi:hypothetical protein
MTEAQPIRVLTWNIQSPLLATKDLNSECSPEHLDSKYRFNSIVNKLNGFIEEKAIIALQEVYGPWYDELSIFFERHGYQCFGRPTGKVGNLIAYPTCTYVANRRESVSVCELIHADYVSRCESHHQQQEHHLVELHQKQRGRDREFACICLYTAYRVYMNQGGFWFIVALMIISLFMYFEQFLLKLSLKCLDYAYHYIFCTVPNVIVILLTWLHSFLTRKDKTFAPNSITGRLFRFNKCMNRFIQSDPWGRAAVTKDHHLLIISTEFVMKSNTSDVLLSDSTSSSSSTSLQSLRSSVTPTSTVSLSSSASSSSSSLPASSSVSPASFCISVYHAPCAFDDPEAMTLHLAKASFIAQQFAGKLPLILCADLNTQPSEPRYDMMTKDGFKASHVTTFGNGTDDVIAPLTSAFVEANQKEPPYTNFTLNFKATIDYQLFRGLRVKKAIEPNCPSGSPCPNSEHPADHLALLVDYYFGTK